MDEKEKLYEAIKKILDRGNNAEVRRKNDGEITIFEVKRHKVTD